MQKNIELFFNHLKTKRVGVIGLGVSHNDLIDLMLKKGIKITLLDRRNAEDIDTYDALKAKGVGFDIGNTYLDNLKQYDVIFRTPGMYYLKQEIEEARKGGVVITSEMEVFFDLCPCKIYGVTGSDGKTTTSTLMAKILEQSGKTVHLGGNIGKPLLSKVESIKENDICVVELSSFQLISMHCSPDVAVVTNISPNHLDVHADMDEYVECKRNILAHQNAFSKTILNLDNQLCVDLQSSVRGKLRFFSTEKAVKNGAYLDANGDICISRQGKLQVLFNKSEIRIPGSHNIANYLTAICAVLDDVSVDDILKVAREFAGVEHRIEFVRKLDGVSYFNDSIASSPTRTIAGLNAFDQKLIIIAGGYDKNIPYEPLAPVLIKRSKLLILLGATAPKIENAVLDCDKYERHPLKIIRVETLEQAVEVARQNAVEGDVVSLSPASASFDLYKNFEERGRHFKKIVNELV